MADLIYKEECFKIIVELKAVSKLSDEHRAQLINHLNATGYELGILVNFGGHPKFEWQRLVHAKRKSLYSQPMESR
jgi:GxxExxY protein